jgi:Cof subfamily protein (haloacid dehalogenase superfamily)
VIRLLALDLDGTLMGDDMVISANVRRAIAAAHERNVVVTLATGRMLDFVLPFARHLGITAPLICYQGGLIQAPDSDVPLYQATMGRVLVREVLVWQARRRQAHDEWQMALYADDAVFITERRYPERVYRDFLGQKLVWVDDLFSVIEKYEPIKLAVFAEPHEADGIEAELRQVFGDRMEVIRSHAMFVEANPLGVSKGDALRRLAAHMGIPQTQVMAVGDQGNDATMIAWAGVGVAMGDGSPAAKAVADWVAPPLAEDGAAVAIERFCGCNTEEAAT